MLGMEFSSSALFYVGVRPTNAKFCYAAIQRLNTQATIGLDGQSHNATAGEDVSKLRRLQSLVDISAARPACW
jgi:hypothetical protein